MNEGFGFIDFATELKNSWFIKLSQSIGELENNMTQVAYIHIPASIKETLGT